MSGRTTILVVAGAALAAWGGAAGSGPVEASRSGLTHRTPRLSPDYSGIVLPPNIAPLNFAVKEAGTRFHVRFYSTTGTPIEVSGRQPAVVIPPRPWRELLRANAGHPLCFEIRTCDSQNRWTRYDTVTNTIAREEIDGYLVYRLIKPLYNLYRDVGIYQRNLETDEQTEVLHNRSFDRGCVNCHTFPGRDPDNMILHIRSKPYANAMLLSRSNEVVKVATAAGYTTWHPSGRLVVFSANKFSQFFHTLGETREVYDAASDLCVYYLDSNSLVRPAPISQANYLETWPSWSPDGRFLYFCRALKSSIEQYRQIRYDLARISYDIEHDTWGEPETMVAARDTGLSAAQPRVSPDGRFLLFCLSDYGNFPIYQASCDLYVMDVATRKSRRLEINSDRSDSWHCWSGNSRWVVFSSKRRDGLFARPYFSYVDQQGVFHKPFLLPQKDPAFYDSFVKTFNVPELVRGPVKVRQQALVRAIVAPRTVLNPKSVTASPPPTPGDHASQHTAEDPDQPYMDPHSIPARTRK